MAKDVQDITTFTGGINNAVEPSDSGEESEGTAFEAVNVDGLQKTGVLRPQGGFVSFTDTDGDPLPKDGMDLGEVIEGRGFHIMQHDYGWTPDPYQSRDFTALTSIPGDITVSDGTGGLTTWSLETATASGSTDNYLRWAVDAIDPVTAPMYGSLSFGTFASGTIYKCEVYWAPGGQVSGNNGTLNDPGFLPLVMYLDPGCYTQQWNGLTFGGADHHDNSYAEDYRITATFYFKSNGQPLKFWVKQFATFGFDASANAGHADNSANAQPIDIYKIDVYKELESGSFEYQFLGGQEGGNDVLDAYINTGAYGSDAILLDGSDPDHTIRWGTQTEESDIDYFMANGSLRVYDGNLDNDVPNRFLGVIDTEYFKDVQVYAGLYHNNDSNTLDGPGPYNSYLQDVAIKRKEWLNEDSKLEAPNARNCFLDGSLGDYIAFANKATIGSPDAFPLTDTRHFHRWFGNHLPHRKEVHELDIPYVIGLEYRCVKTGWHEDHITGTWNAAIDPKHPTLEETEIGYKFYASFTYDNGDQESELTLLTNVKEQGHTYQVTANLSNPNMTPTAIRTQDVDYPLYTGSEFLELGGENGDGEIKLYFHDSATGTGGEIDSFQAKADGELPLGDTWCYTDDSNITAGTSIRIYFEDETTDDTVVETVEDGSSRFNVMATFGGSYDDAGQTATFSWGVESDVGRPIARKAFDTAVAFRPLINVGRQGASEWNLPSRVSGINWYYSTTKDAHVKKFRLIETDFVRGLKFHVSGTNTFEPWKAVAFDVNGDPEVTNTGGMQQDGFSGGGNTSAIGWYYSNSSEAGSPIDGNSTFSGPTVMPEVVFKNPPEIEDWDTLYGIASENWPVIRYKTAVIIGSTAYYGHVKINDNIYKDRILVSMSNHGYDMVPDDNYLEVLPGDGDEIVALLTFEEKLYVFKERSLIVVSIGEEEDSIEGQFKVGGVRHKNQACTTTQGVFWANEYGAFLHDGEDVARLLKDKIGIAATSHDQISNLEIPT